MQRHPEVDLSGVTTLLCDADGTLFPSEEPAFDASAGVMNRALACLGIPGTYTGDELRHAATGRNFRSMLTELARDHGVALPGSELRSWVELELAVVTAHLETTLRPDARIRGPLAHLGQRFELAVVSSSAVRRLQACLLATELEDLFGPGTLFSAQDSLPTPTSKPDPAVYTHAAQALGVDATTALAVEDAVAGVESAQAAGLPVLGIVMLVPEEERDARARELTEAGALAVVSSWGEVEDLLVGAVGRAEPVGGRL